MHPLLIPTVCVLVAIAIVVAIAGYTISSAFDKMMDYECANYTTPKRPNYCTEYDQRINE